MTHQEDYLKDETKINDKQKDIDEIEIWVKSQPHLSSLTKFQINRFIHSCYNDLELTKSTINNFFTLRTSCPHIFDFSGIEKIKLIAAIGSTILLPKTTADGDLVFIIKLLDSNPNIYKLVDQINFFDKVAYIAFEENGFANGIRVIADWDGFSFRHLLKFHLDVMKNFIFYCQNAMPARLKGIHFININFVLKNLFWLTKPFCTQKLINMLFFHQDIFEFYKFIPQEILPEEYGGKAPSIGILTQQSVAIISNNQHIFETLDKQKVDETKRLTKTASLLKLF